MRPRWRRALRIGPDSCAPILPTACAWRTARARGRCTASWAPCCASVSRAGTPRCSPERPSSAWSLACARIARTACGTAGSSAGCCASKWSRRAPARRGRSARARRAAVLAMLPGTTGVAPERIRVRTRRRTRRGEQYDKVGEQARFHVVTEGGLRFRVNFEDYLDTGLFLDQRTTRARLRDAARGKRFLNLFAYTGAATVYAAAGGAASTTSVDLSRTYIEWGRRNLALNALTGEAHAWVQADCREWLTDAARGSQRFDLVFLDPPTFSNSKRMQGVLDIERDHPELIDACARLLAPQGLLLFSTNAQRFRLQEQLAERYQIRDLSAATLPRDFERNPRIHRCFEVRPRAPQPCGEP